MNYEHILFVRMQYYKSSDVSGVILFRVIFEFRCTIIMYQTHYTYLLLSHNNQSIVRKKLFNIYSSVRAYEDNYISFDVLLVFRSTGYYGIVLYCLLGITSR